ncbi:MAG: response regulator [Chitinophagaceae bacterium]|nr:response regulator [Chitinophagaceae bacterium]
MIQEDLRSRDKAKKKVTLKKGNSFSALYKLQLFLMLGLYLLQVEGKAQSPVLNFTRYLQKDGLMSSIVYDIQRDNTGFVWLATEDGLYKYDGNRFWEYRHEPGSNTGLRVNFISALENSKSGTLWIGTSGGGLHYYDPKMNRIMPYNGDPQNQIPLAITSLSEDKNGNLLITGFGGFEAVRSQNKALITLSDFKEMSDILRNKVTTACFQDSKGNYFIGSNEGVFKFSSQKKWIATYPAGLSNGKGKGPFVNEITEDKDGKIWVGTETGLFVLKENDPQPFSGDNLPSGQYIGSKPVYDLMCDNQNRLWIGTSEGLMVYHQQINQVSKHIPDPRNPASISSASIRSIFYDGLGSYWIGTFRGGLNKYDENLNLFSKITYNPFDPLGIKSPKITAFAHINGKIYLGTDGGGLQYFDKNTGTVSPLMLPQFTNTTQANDAAIMYLAASGNRLLWIGTYSFGLYVYDTETRGFKHYNKGNEQTDLNNDQIFAVTEDSKGNIWIGTNGGGINIIRPGQANIEKFQYDPLQNFQENGPGNNYIRSFLEDDAGKMWVGTFGGGVSVFDPSSGKFTHYTHENSSLPSNYILDMAKDKMGNIYIGTSGEGLAILKKGGQKFDHITEKEGLPNGVINKILINEEGNLWISTNTSICFFNPNKMSVNTYNTQNGLQEGAFLPRSGILTPEGEIYFGGEAGFNYFNPKTLRKNNNVPPVVFTTLKVNNLPVQPGEPKSVLQSALNYTEALTLKHNQTFTIGFEALDFTNPANNKYLYKLEGFDEDWQPANKEHTAAYSNLPPGNYTFRVKASNNDGVWNEEGRSLRIRITPPWWKSYEAYLLYLVIAGLAIYLIRKNSIRKIHEKIALDLERKNIRKEMEYERQKMEDIRKVDQMKMNFITNISHEFKTPLSLILGPIDHLIQETHDEPRLNKLKMVKRNSRRLLNLVNQLLDFRKMESGEVRLIEKEGDLIAFLKDAYESFYDLSVTRKINYTFSSEAAALLVYFDHQKLERILFNLLSNAFKFTKDKGSISLQVEEVKYTPEKDFVTVEIAVTDNGIGMPKAIQGQIFDNFFQHHTDTEKLNQGSGIGLAITKEFVTLHRGDIKVHSKPEEGSTFSFTLNLRVADTAAELEIPANGIPITNEATSTAEDDADDRREMRTKPLILIVEDDEDFRKYLKEMLEPAYKTIEANNGKEGWQKALFNHPDLMLCDIQMPVMNGFELVKKVKNDKRTKHIPVILITAADTPQAQIDGLETGAIDYITKPFDLSILKAKVQNILQLNQIYKDTYSKKLTLSLPETEAQSENEVFMTKTVNYIYENLENPQLSVELLSEFMNISRASLYNKIIEYTGMSPVDFIKSVKLEKAKDLLEKTDKTVAEIAHETGFANPNYFTKVFKAKYLMTPTEYALKMKGQTRG